MFSQLPGTIRVREMFSRVSACVKKEEVGYKNVEAFSQVHRDGVNISPLSPPINLKSNLQPPPLAN